MTIILVPKYSGDKFSTNPKADVYLNGEYPDNAGVGEDRVIIKHTFTCVKPSDVKYNLWLGSTRVTAKNADDIFGDGLASFDPYDSTLVLYDPDIKSMYIDDSGDSNKIYSKGMNLRIRGSWIMDEDAAKAYHCISVKSGDLTLEGYFEIYGKYHGLYSEGDLDILAGEVRSYADYDGFYGIYAYNAITIYDDVKEVSCQGGEKAIYSTMGKLDVPGSFKLWYEDQILSNYTVYEEDGFTPADLVMLNNNNSDLPVIWLGAMPVFPDYYDDIFGDGTASFDYEEGVLYLDEPQIKGEYKDSDHTYKIFIDDNDCHETFTVTGSYHMTGLECGTGLYFDEDCDLLVLDGDFTFRGEENGIRVRGDSCLTIESGSVKAYSNEYAALSASDIRLGYNVTRIELDSNNGTAISAYGLDEAIDGLYEIKSPTGAVIESYGIYLSDGETEASYVVIVPAKLREYGIWLGSTRVNENNKNDILGDGKAKFDPESRILTLKEPVIKNKYDNNGYICDIVVNTDLTIEGSYHMTSEGVNDEGLSCGDYTVTLDGDFNFYGNKSGMSSDGRLIVKSGSLKAVGKEIAGGWLNNAVFENGVTKAEFEGGEYFGGLRINEIEIGDALAVVEPSGGYTISTVYQGRIIAETDYKSARYVTIQSNRLPVNPIERPTFYKLWVGSTQVSTANKDDILGDGGKAKYDPATNTLTLNDPVIYGSKSDCKIYYPSEGDLTVKGRYHMPSADVNHGISVTNGVLIMDGDFTFFGKYYGVLATKGLTVRSGSLKATGGNFGVNTYDAFTAEKGARRIELISEGNTDSLFALNCASIELDASLKITTPEGAKISENKYILEADGVTKAKRVVIMNPAAAVSYMRGDVDESGKVNVFDASYIFPLHGKMWDSKK